MFNELKNFLFIDALKNKNDHESVVMIIDNVSDKVTSRIDMTLGLINYYFNNNFDKYMTIYILTMQPKNYMMTIFPNTVENYINALLNIRYCDQLSATFFSEIKLHQEITSNSVAFIFSKRGSVCIPKIYLHNAIECFPVTIIKNLNYDNYMSAEQMSYKDIATIPIKNKFHFKNKFVKFINSSDAISLSPYDHDIFVGNIIDDKFVMSVDDNVILNLNEIENQKKLFSCLMILYIKYKTNPSYILNLVETSLHYLQLLDPKYNFLKNELHKYVNKNKLITYISTNLCDVADDVVINNRTALNFYNICEGQCVGIQMSTRAKLTSYNFVHINDCFTEFFSLANYVKILDQKKYDCNQYIVNATNFILPVYINKSHWEASLKYITKIFPLVFTHDFHEYSENLLNVYYSVLTHYSRKLFFVENIVNWDEQWINCWIALFHTCYQISASNKYYKGFEKYISKNQTYNCSTVLGQAISVNYKNYVMLYNVIEHEILSKLINHIEKEAVGLKELIIENDSNLITELEIAIKNISVIKEITESFIATSFVLAMIKDILGGISDICTELESSDGVVNQNITKKLYDYCETFRELETENKIQILVNKNKIPIEHIFQSKTLCKKIKSHYQNL